MNNKSRRFLQNNKSKRLQKQPIPSQRNRAATNTSSIASAESYRKDKEKALTLFFKKKKTKGRKPGLPSYKTRPRPKVKGQKKTNDIHSQWTFSVSNLSEYALKDAAVEMVYEAYRKLLTYSQHKPLPPERQEEIQTAVIEFVDKVEQSYCNSRFHNFKHAVDVTQMMYFLITTYFNKRLKPEEMFYVIIAALCHDIFHPGVNYSFLKKNGYLLEVESLEDYHVKKTLELVNSEDIQLFQEPFLTTKQRTDIVQYVTYLISATNIAKHEIYIKEAEKLKVKKDGFLKKEHMAILMKISDLANISRDFEDSWKWSINFKIETAAEKELENIDAKKESLEELTARLVSKQDELSNKFKEEQSLSEGTSETTLKFMKHFARRLVSCLKDLNTEAGITYGTRIRKNQEKWSSFKRNEVKHI